jgi:hypothetical protein
VGRREERAHACTSEPSLGLAVGIHLVFLEGNLRPLQPPATDILCVV